MASLHLVVLLLLLAPSVGLLHAHVHEGALLVSGPGSHAALTAVQLKIRHAATQVGLVLRITYHVGSVAANISLGNLICLLFFHLFGLRVAAAAGVLFRVQGLLLLGNSLRELLLRGLHALQLHSLSVTPAHVAQYTPSMAVDDWQS